MNRFGSLALVLSALAFVAGVASPLPAEAGTCTDSNKADLRQLHDELQRMAGKNQHSAVVRTFTQMLSIAKKNCEIAANDYVLAGGASRNLGDIQKALEWLDAGKSTDAADLRARFAQVEIKGKAADLAKDGGVPFATDERAALEIAVREVKAKGKYTGYLPIGGYTLGSKTFTVAVGAVAKP
ncbi:MAG: hypothetical protein U0174_13855 [Polyangiaceae bacterium]